MAGKTLEEQVAKAAGVKVQDVDAVHKYPDGSIVATTVHGQKIVVDQDGNSQIATGPGAEPEAVDLPLAPVEASPSEEPSAPISENVPGADVPPPVEGEHYEVFKGSDKKWYFRRVNALGDEVSRSTDAYSTRKAARAEAHRENPGLEVRNV